MSDAELIERVAQAMYERPGKNTRQVYIWAKAKGYVKDDFRADAAEAVRVFREQEQDPTQ